jgi:hypothetical protein
MVGLPQDHIAFFETLADGFERAAGRAGTVERFYRIAERNVRLCFAGEALIPSVAPALAHLEIEEGGGRIDKPDFTVFLYDEVSTGAKLPFLAGRFVNLLRLRWWEYLGNRGEITGLSGERIRSVFHLGPDILNCLDTRDDRAVYWVEDASNIPYYEKGYPMSVLLNWWLAGQGVYCVHAASIGDQKGGVLLAGSGGSGKSTTSLACVTGDLGIAGDDYTAVDPVEMKAFSLYNTVKLKTLADVDRFPGLRRHIDNLDRVVDGDRGEKAMVFLADGFSSKMIESMPLRAILVPRISNLPGTEIVPASPATAFKALAPSTVFQLPGNAHDAFRALGRLARALPCREIVLGKDLASIPRAIRKFLAHPW